MRTSLYSILCIGIRLAAVLLAVNTLLTLPAGYASLSNWGKSETGWLALLWLIVLLVAVLLWIYPGVLARLAAGKASQQVFESPISASEFERIVFCVVGLWILLAGLVELFGVVLSELFVVHVLRSSPSVDADALKWRFIVNVTQQILRIVLGSALMLRAQGLVEFLRRARHAGLPPATEETP